MLREEQTEFEVNVQIVVQLCGRYAEIVSLAVDAWRVVVVDALPGFVAACSHEVDGERRRGLYVVQFEAVDGEDGVCID